MTLEKKSQQNEATQSIQNQPQTTQGTSSSGSQSIFEKCVVCSKKLMVNIKCKCSNHYCEKHRYNHNCSYSYFLENKANLEKKNQKVEADKIVRL
jgi:hypothetical protein